MSEDFDERQDELLALQSIFGSEEFDRDESKFAGHVRVSVELPSDFNVVLKDGERLRQYEISFLPPLLLTFDLPEDYPSSSPPTFTLTCSWLTHAQLAALAAQLIELYQDTGGAVVLFSWVQFLKEDALKFLDIHSQLELPCDGHSTPNREQNAESSEPTDGQYCNESNPLKPDISKPSSEVKQHPSASDEGSTDSQEALEERDIPVSSLLLSSSSDSLDLSEQRAASLPDVPQSKDRHVSGLSLTSSQTLLSQILIYDVSQRERAFATTVFDCGVCFTGWLGSYCVQLDECGHIFCRTCLGVFCKLHITEGTVRSVTCPQVDCTAALTPAQVKSLVGEELFSRYDHLLLQSTLDCMPDIKYCPRCSCGSAIIRDKSSNVAMCSECCFVFCMACRKTYHGTDACQGEKTSQVLAELPQTKEGIKALWDDYDSGSEERRRLLEKRYGASILQGIVEASLSESWMSVNTKSCPRCFCRIEKNLGCKTVRCILCWELFCWVCLTRLLRRTSYQHFMDGSCASASD